MTFTLYSLNRAHSSSECFFAVQIGSATFYSPFYLDQKAAFKAMEDLVLRLRSEESSTDQLLHKSKNGYTLSLFGSSKILAGESAIFTSKSEAWELMTQLHQAAKKQTFKLSFLELAEEVEGLKRISDLDPLSTDRTYQWADTGNSVLRVDQKGILPVSPAMGMQLGLNRNPCDPIFNVFQPYVATDLPLFHGRTQDVDEFYDLILKHPLLLLYGLPGVGKSSLILCGLANRMAAEDGELLVTRREEAGILAAFRETLYLALESAEQTDVRSTNSISLLIEQLHAIQKKPLLLIFDQLEDLFQTHVSEEERHTFFTFVQDLIDKEDLPCRIILVLRESYLAPLADYEEMLPSLLDNRYHLQPLKKDSMANLTFNLLDVLQLQGKAKVEDPKAISEKICEELANENGDVPFQCLQIYLHQMQQATCSDSNGAPPLFSSAVADQMGPPREVIDDYINKKIAGLREQAGDEISPEIQRQIDELNQSRQQCGCPDANPAAPTALVAVAAANTKKVRNLRWLLLLALLALLLSFIAYWLFFNWLQKQDDPCEQAQDAATCEAYINYLIRYGEDSACAEKMQQLLAEQGCTVWTDYQLIQRTSTCGTYQDFFDKYRYTEVNTDQVQKALLDWECPVVRDTVTLRDTITQIIDRPTPSNRIGSRIGSTGSQAGCKDIAGENFKRVGPLWIMTDALEGGPYTWENALDACKAKGWRLPCIGEVEFLIENIYRGQGSRAYQMLSGSGACYLVKPSEVLNNRIDFWTGTEANDATAWTFYFDTTTKTIGRESNIPKSRALPCLCVEKEDQGGVSGIPPCYQKNIDR